MTDLQALALAKSIRYAALVLAAGMVLLGLMIWQPWAEPEHVWVEYNTNQMESCVTYKSSVWCS